MLKIGSYIEGKYKILNKIGQGGMSVVYLAMNEKANKQWAIKEVRKDGVTDFAAVRQGLVVEIELLKRLNHPNLPSIVDVIEDQDTLLIVMDYIQGNPLSKTVDEYGAQPQDLVIDWAIQLCDVLEYLHSQAPPIIYRDMKPGNIMLKPDGKITLIDFGTAREFKERNSSDTVCLGTIGYAAPEQFGGLGQTDPRTDIYCLGATLYHLLTGRNPSEPPYEIVPIRKINPSLSSGLEKILHKCLQRNPDDRYQTAAELTYALEHYEEIDEKFRRKEIAKLMVFATSFGLSLIFAAISVFGYISSMEKKQQNYGVKLAEASNMQLETQQRIDLYLDAIKIDPSLPEAYLELLQFFLSSEKQEGSFSKEESNVITSLKAGLDIKNSNGFTSTLYPLEILKKSNNIAYQDVCYEIGLAYWYDFEVQNDRYSSSVEWFSKSVEKHPIAQIFCDLGEIQQKIKRYAGQDRTQDLYNSYTELWNKLLELNAQANIVEDNDTKVLVWKEIVYTTSDKVSYFSQSIPQKEIVSLLDSIEKQSKELEKKVELEEFKKSISNIQKSIEIARSRVLTTKVSTNIRKGEK